MLELVLEFYARTCIETYVGTGVVRICLDSGVLTGDVTSFVH